MYIQRLRAKVKAGLNQRLEKNMRNQKLETMGAQFLARIINASLLLCGGNQSASDLLIAEDGADSENSSADGHANDFTNVVNKRAAKRRRRRTKQDGISFAVALNKPVPVASPDPAVKP